MTTGHRWNMRRGSLHTPISLGAAVFSLVSAVAAGWAVAQPAQRTFATPEAGVAALIDAARKDDLAALESILGPASRDVISSGDPVADAAARDDFVAAYDEKSNLATVNDNTRTLQIGQSDWPLPIPLVREGSMWRFDTAAGREELINRRIGRNELNAIEAAQAFVDAQQDYASADRDGDKILEYAQLFGSTDGMKNGLYWPVQPGEPESPLGPFFADAQTEGYFQEAATQGARAGRPPEPYYGYRYLILTAQGPSAPGGAYDYIVDGNMIGGVAMIAYPAEYGVSGVMTFIVNHDGAIYQRDLGQETADFAESVTEFNPDNMWQRVQTSIPVATAP